MNRNKDYSKLLNKVHENKWIALSENYDKILGYSENLVELRDEIDSLTDQKVIYTKVLSPDVLYAF